jgi:hypothetical protein
VPSKFNVVDMRRGADFEDSDEFVLGSVKRSHAAIVFVPDAEVETVVHEKHWRRGQALLIETG